MLLLCTLLIINTCFSQQSREELVPILEKHIDAINFSVDEDATVKYFTINGAGAGWFAPSGNLFPNKLALQITSIHGFRNTAVNASGAIGITYWLTSESLYSVFARFQRWYLFIEPGQSFYSGSKSFSFFVGLTTQNFLGNGITVDAAYGGIDGPMLLIRVSYGLYNF